MISSNFFMKIVVSMILALIREFFGPSPSALSEKNPKFMDKGSNKGRISCFNEPRFMVVPRSLNYDEVNDSKKYKIVHLITLCKWFCFQHGIRN